MELFSIRIQRTFQLVSTPYSAYDVLPADRGRYNAGICVRP